MIEAKNLNFFYGDKKILNDINIEIAENRITAIIGPNGSGKTTLAKHLNALLVPSKGKVLVDGIDTKSNPTKAREKVGFVFQNFEEQIIYSTVEEDVAFGLENIGLNNEEIKKRIKETLSSLGILDLAKSNVNFLSMGQKQLVALAGVLTMRPKYVVFDEPTTMLDSRNRKNIGSIIKNLKKWATVVMVTNNLSDLKYADDIIALKKGSVVFNGKKSKLKKNMDIFQ